MTALTTPGRAGQSTLTLRCCVCRESWTPPGWMPVSLYLAKARQFVGEHVKCRTAGKP